MSELLNKFIGLVSNVNPHNVPPGAFVSMENVGIFQPGTASVRKGLPPLGYTGFTSAGSGNVMAMAKFDRPEAYWILYVLTTGVLKAIRNGAQASIRTGLNITQPMCIVR